MARLITIIIFPDFQLLDAAGPIAAFEIAARPAGADGYRIVLASRDGGLVASSSGAALQTEAWSALPTRGVDTLLVAGGQGIHDPTAREDVARFVRAAARGARRIASVCSGAFALAEAGLLDGRRATTHWSRATQLQRQHPTVRVEADAIFVKDGRIWTSAGISAGVDLALAMIGEDLGEDAARRTAQTLVVYHRRPAGQSQFSALLEVGQPHGRFAALNAWVRESLHQPLTVEALAAHAGMSQRNFARAYAAETGFTPAKAIERFRVEAAQAMLRTHPLRVEEVASKTGFKDPERMRRAFLRAFGQPPQAMRRGAKAARASARLA
jgi:transcriptional regulator GlxA family with amidase domain